MNRKIDLGQNYFCYHFVWSNINFDLCFYCCSDSNSEFDDECTLSASELLSSTQGEEDMEISSTGDCGNIEVVVPYGPETREEWRKS